MENTEIKNRAEALKDWLMEVRRDFHMHPELGMEEIRTRDKIAGYLEEMGIPYQIGIAKTGIVGLIKGKEPGRTVALRADMDALPMVDEKDVPYKSQLEGKMHACGHDAHMTILLGTARVLNEMKDNIKGNIKLLFQPAEESVGGAEKMIQQGAMENPKVDVVFGLHVSPEIPVGKIGVKYGQMNAASDAITIDLYGTSCHGAYPHGGIDAIVMAGQIITALQTIVSRVADPRDSAVVSIGVIKGGTASNIIANHVEMKGTVRTLLPSTREKVINTIQKIVTQVAEAMGGTGKVTRSEGYCALINDDRMVDLVRENGKELLGNQNVEELSAASLGVEDFAFFLKEAPGAFFRVGCRNEERGIIYDGHSTLFDIDEGCLPIGVMMQVKNVLTVLGEE
ncbi:MAG: M20 metallopeptidase family protein [Bacillota bacterium]